MAVCVRRVEFEEHHFNFNIIINNIEILLCLKLLSLHLHRITVMSLEVVLLHHKLGHVNKESSYPSLCSKI